MSELLIVFVAIMFLATMFLIIGGIGYIAFSISVWLGVSYIALLIALIIYFLFKQTENSY